MNKYSLLLKQYSDNVNSALRECQRTEGGLPQGVVVEEMHYRVLDAVKRLRAKLARTCSVPKNISSEKSEVETPELVRRRLGKRAAKGTDDE